MDWDRVVVVQYSHHLRPSGWPGQPCYDLRAITMVDYRGNTCSEEIDIAICIQERDCFVQPDEGYNAMKIRTNKRSNPSCSVTGDFQGYFAFA